MSRTIFDAIAAPEGHRKCERVDEDPSVTFPKGRTWWLCECNRPFQIRSDLTDHHTLTAQLKSSVLTSRGRR